ncbi:MAG: hypothetical protein ACHQEM_07085 [Chitinophagales bacterium]
MESTVSIDQFHEVLQSWKHELTSSKHEIRHFERHLENLSSKNLPKELLAQVEHFQNSFICQKEVIDKLRHDLPDSRHKVEYVFNSKVRQENDASADAHSLLGERMDIFRRIYGEVKDDFKKFEEAWV